MLKEWSPNQKKPAEGNNFRPVASTCDGLRNTSIIIGFSKELGDYIRASACDIGLIWQAPRPTQCRGLLRVGSEKETVDRLQGWAERSSWTNHSRGPGGQVAVHYSKQRQKKSKNVRKRTG